MTENERKIPPAKRPPAASVVIPTYGRRSSLLSVLQALARQSVPSGTFEVIVVCDGDVDGTAESCHALANDLPYALRVVVQSNQGPAVARNRGVSEARAPLIIFVDDDVVADEQLIATHLRAQEGQEARVTIGPLLPPSDCRLSPWAAWEEHTLCRQYDAMSAGRWHATYRQFYTGNASVLKRHIAEAGGFDSAYRRAEDVELALRLRDRGLHFVFLSDARGWHYVSRTFASWLRIPAAYGAADVAMARAGRPEVLATVAREYRDRNRIVRLLTGISVARPMIREALVAAMETLVLVTDRVHATKLGHLACSLIFSVRYYDGLAGALGGRAAFELLIRSGDVEAAVLGLDGPKAA